MKVFLSHSSIDKPAVRRIYKALAPHGLELWLDERELLPADSLIDKIQSAITEATCVLAFISANSIKSNWVKTELNAFLALEEAATRPLVIPVILDQATPPPFLAHRIQVRTQGKSLGSVVQELLRGILRTHAVLRLQPLSNQVFKLDSFSDEIEQFKTQGLEGALYTVFDAFELADKLVDAFNDEDDITDAVKSAIPRSLEILAALSPKLIQVALSLEPTAAGPGQAERLIQLVWRMVMFTFIDSLSRHIDESKIHGTSVYNLSSALSEHAEITSDRAHYHSGFGIRPAVWLRYHGTTLRDTRDYAFIGRKRADGTRVRTEPFIFIPDKYLERGDPTAIPELDFFHHRWLAGVLPLLVANAIIDAAFAGLETKKFVAALGLRPEDFETYSPG